MYQLQEIHNIVTGIVEKRYSKVTIEDLKAEVKKINNFRGMPKILVLRKDDDNPDGNPYEKGYTLYEENAITKTKKVIHRSKVAKSMFEYLHGINSGIALVLDTLETRGGVVNG